MRIAGRSGRRWRTTVAISVTTMAALWISPSAARSAGAGLHRTSVALEQWLDRSDTPLTSYRALRRLTATARGGKLRASMVAWTELDPAYGFRYSVVSEEGSESVRRRVFRAVLEGERQAESSGETRKCLVGPANYTFEPGAATADGLLRVAVRARREHPMLVNGAIFFRPNDGDLVRVEGQLAKRPSFWTRRVEIVRRYARIAGIHVPVAFESTAHVLLVGEGTLTMSWEYERINGIAVGSPGRVAMVGEE